MAYSKKRTVKAIGSIIISSILLQCLTVGLLMYWRYLKKKSFFLVINFFRILMADHLDLHCGASFRFFFPVLWKTYTRLIKFKEKWFQLNQHPGFNRGKSQKVKNYAYWKYVCTLSWLIKNNANLILKRREQWRNNLKEKVYRQNVLYHNLN